jgi:hypothetical protein
MEDPTKASDLLNELQQAWGWNGLTPSQILAENEFGNLLIKDQRRVVFGGYVQKRLTAR